MPASSKRKAAPATEDNYEEDAKRCRRNSSLSGFPCESRWSSSQSSSESNYSDGSTYSDSSTPATTEAQTPPDCSRRRSSHVWAREEELRLALEAALIADFGPSPQGLSHSEQQEEDDFWEMRGVSTVWWQAPTGFWFKKPEVTLQFNAINWSGESKKPAKVGSRRGVWHTDKPEPSYG